MNVVVFLIAGTAPFSAITAFAGDNVNGEYTITNEVPESDRNINNGYVSVPEKLKQAPKNDATRVQVAAIFERFCENMLVLLCR